MSEFEIQTNQSADVPDRLPGGGNESSRLRSTSPQECGHSEELLRSIAESYRFTSSVILSADTISAGVSQRVTAADFNAIVLATVKTMGAVPRLKVPSFDPPVSYVSALLTGACPTRVATSNQPRQQVRKTPVVNGDDGQAKAAAGTKRATPKKSEKTSSSKSAGDGKVSTSKSAKPTPALGPKPAGDPEIIKARKQLRSKALRASKSAAVTSLNQYLVEPVTETSVKKRLNAMSDADVLASKETEYGPSAIARLGFLNDENRKSSWAADLPVIKYVDKVLNNAHSAAATADGQAKNNSYACFRPVHIDVLTITQVVESQKIALDLAQHALKEALRRSEVLFQIANKSYNVKDLDILDIRVLNLHAASNDRQGRFLLELSMPRKNFGIATLGKPDDCTQVNHVKVNLACKFILPQKRRLDREKGKDWLTVLIWRPKADAEFIREMTDVVYVHGTTVCIDRDETPCPPKGKTGSTAPVAPKGAASPPGGAGCSSRRTTPCGSPEKGSRGSSSIKKK